MKVVKCLEHIDKRFWGRIVEDSSDFKPSDTFPLPTQGDKVECSDNGINFYPESEEFECYDEKNKRFVAHLEESYTGYPYIRPIAKEEDPCANITFSNVPEGYRAVAVKEDVGIYAIKLIKTNK